MVLGFHHFWINVEAGGRIVANDDAENSETLLKDLKRKAPRKVFLTKGGDLDKDTTGQLNFSGPDNSWRRKAKH